jgi:hypothetical protein
MAREAKHKSISRIDQPEKHTHGWYVRVRYAKHEVSKFFPDKLHGSKKKALEQAIRFRDRTERELGKPRTDRLVVGRSPRGRNKIIGVRRVVKTTTTVSGEIRKNAVYEVTWSPEPNIVQRTSISIRKYGAKEAYRRAVALRESKEKEFYRG